MIGGRDRRTDDALVCADVLGAFGVAASDVRREADRDAPLEAVLSDALADARDRTEFCRRAICEADRGIDCPARYPGADLERELRSLFDGLGWSASVDRSGCAGFDLAVTDGSGRSREVSVTYPDTPLGTDNLPAVLATLEERLLAGVDARFVLLSDGVDRWRAALIEADELERVRDRYGDRVSAFDRPLLGSHDPADFAPAYREGPREPWPEWASGGSGRSVGRSSGPLGSEIAATAGGSDDARSEEGAATVDGFIEEAESDPGIGRSGSAGATATAGRSERTGDDHGTAGGADGDADDGTDEDETGGETLGEMWASGADDTEREPDPRPDSSAPEPEAESFVSETATPEWGSGHAGSGSGSESTASESPPKPGTSSARTDAHSSAGSGSTTSSARTAASTASETAETEGFTLAGGSPTVSRTSDDGAAADGDGPTADEASSDSGRREAADDTDSSVGGGTTVSVRDDRETGTSGFGTLSGSSKTARVTNDSFGADVETQTEDERYQALGAALGSGGGVSVKGLLDDDEFLPELPAAEPETTRIRFEDAFEPEAVTEAKAAAEESGFVWVDSGSMETTRVSN